MTSENGVEYKASLVKVPEKIRDKGRFWFGNPLRTKHGERRAYATGRANYAGGKREGADKTRGLLAGRGGAYRSRKDI